MMALLPPARVAAQAQAGDLEALLTGVAGIGTPGTPESLCVFGEQAFPLVAGDSAGALGFDVVFLGLMAARPRADVNGLLPRVWAQDARPAWRALAAAVPAPGFGRPAGPCARQPCCIRVRRPFQTAFRRRHRGHQGTLPFR